MYEVTTRTAPPYSSIVYIESFWSDGTGGWIGSRASGVVVGYNDVLTALHVVYDADHGGWAQRVTIIPALDTQPWNEPYGEFTNFGQLAGRASNWDLNGDGYLTQAESAGDLALIGMKTRIGDVTGWLPVAQQPNDFYGLMAGYPKQLGTGLMAEQVAADASSTDSVYNIDSGLGGGASGGPLLQTVNGVTSVVGVLSGGSVTDSMSTYAGLFGQDTWSWLQGALQANDSLLGYSLPTSTPSGTGLILTGGGGDNLLTGTGGWDTFTGGGGNDTLEGGGGIDTAIYWGPRAAYAIAASDTSVTIGDSVTGRDGRDTLDAVERANFSDISLAFDIGGAAGQAYRLYQTAFNRAPDLAGFGYWMHVLDVATPLSAVAAAFVTSAEFQGRFGELQNEQFVTQLYGYALHREPDAGGLAFHTASLDGGASRADVVVTFSESPENQAALIGVIRNGMPYTG